MNGSLEIQTAGTASYAGLTGNPTDNTALAAALNACVAKAGDAMTGALSIGAAGAASSPTLQLTGAVFTGGSGTTTKPQLLIEPTGTTSTGWSTAGTLLGVNAPGGFGGMLVDAKVAGDPAFTVDTAGRIRCGSGAAPLQLRGLYGNFSLVQFGGGGMMASQPVAFPEVGVGDVAYRTAFCSAAAGGVEQQQIIEQRNGTIPQRLGIFNVDNSSTNREFVELGFSPASNVAHVWTVKGSGGGAARELHLGHDSTANLKLGAGGAVDFSGLTLTTEGISATSTFQIKIGGTTVKVPCVVV